MIGRIDKLVAHRSDTAVLVVEVRGFDGLRAIDEEDARLVVREVESRLDRLLRSGDVLGFVDPARFLLVCPHLAVEDAGALIERVRGGAALPVELGGEAVSLSLDVGVAFASDGASGVALVESAETELERARREA